MVSGEYAFIAAFLKSAESGTAVYRPIPETARLARVQDIADALSDTEIGEYLAGVSPADFDEADRQLWAYFNKSVERIYWFNSVPNEIKMLLQAYVTKYDLMNINGVLRALKTGQKIPLIPAGVMNWGGFLPELESAKDLSQVVDILVDANLLSYAGILKNYETLDKKEALNEIEIAFSEAYYSELLAISGSIDGGYKLAGVFGAMADLKVLKTVIRKIVARTVSDTADKTIGGGYLISKSAANEMLSLKLNELPAKLEGTQYKPLIEEIITEFNKDEDVAAIDVFFEKKSFAFLKDILSSGVMTASDVVWYLYVKETEMRNVRIIYKAVFDGIPLENIKDYLVTVG
ncbi:MAG: V-type ATPase subunit [Dehalococcoidales bacterium]